MGRIKYLVHTQDARDMARHARDRGVRRSEMIWCQSPHEVRGLGMEHLQAMTQLHGKECDSRLCDETLSHLRRIGWPRVS